MHFHSVSGVYCVARLPDSRCALQYFKQVSWLAQINFGFSLCVMLFYCKFSQFQHFYSLWSSLKPLLNIMNLPFMQFTMPCCVCIIYHFHCVCIAFFCVCDCLLRFFLVFVCMHTGLGGAHLMVFSDFSAHSGSECVGTCVRVCICVHVALSAPACASCDWDSLFSLFCCSLDALFVPFSVWLYFPFARGFTLFPKSKGSAHFNCIECTYEMPAA